MLLWGSCCGISLLSSGEVDTHIVALDLCTVYPPSGAGVAGCVVLTFAGLL